MGVDEALLRQFYLTTFSLMAPILLAALGELIGERAGVLNIGLEGMMLAGAWAGAIVSYLAHSGGMGLLAAAGTGMLVAALFALLSIYYQADPVVVGTGLNLMALGLTGTFNRVLATKYPDIKSTTVPERYLIDLAVLLVPVIWFLLHKTKMGLRWRAAGEQPAAAEAAGTNVPLVQWLATLCNGALCGIGGAFLTMSSVDSFVENATVGRGFIALAIVIFGRWSPLGALGAALLFGAASAAEITLQGHISPAYNHLLLSLPYLLTLLTLAGFSGRSNAPAALNLRR